VGLFDRIFRRNQNEFAFPPDLRSQVERATAGLQMLTAAHDRMWQIGEAAWNVDQGTGTITFTSPKGLCATAPVQIIGSFNTADNTWLWSWANPSIQPPLTEHARKLQAYGREKGYIPLTTPKFSTTETRCWDLAALACMLCEAQGAYRGPAGPARIFMTFGEVALRKAT